MSNSSEKFVKKVPYRHSIQIANNTRIPVVSKCDALLQGDKFDYEIVSSKN